MSTSEILTSPEVAEPKLEQIIDRFRASEFGNLSVFVYFGLDGTPQAAWEVLSELVDLPLKDQQKLFNVLLVGKYNPANDLHRRLVETAMHNMEQT